MDFLTICITGCRDSLNWYHNRIGEYFKAIFDPFVEKYLACTNGGGSRYIDPDDVKVVGWKGG